MYGRCYRERLSKYRNAKMKSIVAAIVALPTTLGNLRSEQAAPFGNKGCRFGKRLTRSSLRFVGFTTRSDKSRWKGITIPHFATLKSTLLEHGETLTSLGNIQVYTTVKDFHISKLRKVCIPQEPLYCGLDDMIVSIGQTSVAISFYCRCFTFSTLNI